MLYEPTVDLIIENKMSSTATRLTGTVYLTSEDG